MRDKERYLQHAILPDLGNILERMGSGSAISVRELARKVSMDARTVKKWLAFTYFAQNFFPKIENELPGELSGVVVNDFPGRTLHFQPSLELNHLIVNLLVQNALPGLSKPMSSLKLTFDDVCALGAKEARQYVNIESKDGMRCLSLTEDGVKRGSDIWRLYRLQRDAWEKSSWNPEEAFRSVHGVLRDSGLVHSLHPRSSWLHNCFSMKRPMFRPLRDPCVVPEALSVFQLYASKVAPPDIQL